MAYQSLYRKWRPQKFSDIVGQDHIIKTLQNEMERGAVSHAYLFCGSRGTGKTTTAKVFAKALNCLNPSGTEPCNECSACKGVNDGSLLDVIEMDAASNTGVEYIRDLRDEINYLPVGVKYKIYIIDEIHMLSINAFNALLKTLEEPPEHAIFIFATTEVHKLPVTILSRCQRFDFRLVPDNLMRERLEFIAKEEGFSVSASAMNLIIKGAKGGMRDAVSILDQCASYKNGAIDDEIVWSVTGLMGNDYLLKVGDCILNYDYIGALKLTDKAITLGYDVLRIAECFAGHFRNLTVSLGDGAEDLIEASDGDRKKIKEQALKFGAERAIVAFEAIIAEYDGIKYSANSRLILEAVIMKLAHQKVSSDLSPYKARLDELECEIETLKSKLASGDFVSNAELSEEEEEEYVPDIEEAQDEEYIPDIQAPEEEHAPDTEAKSEATSNSVIYDRWAEVLDKIGETDVMLKMGILNVKFRLEGNKLVLLDIVDYLQTKENVNLIKDAVLEICDVPVEISFESEKAVVTDLSGANDDDDPLAALAKQLQGNINIKS